MRLFLFLFILASHLSFGQSEHYVEMLNNYYDGFPTITIDHAKEKVGEKGVYFLDTREIKEFNIGHIKNATHVGYDKFKLSSVKHIPKDAFIIVYCSIGARSQNIGKKLKKAGYSDVNNLYGGLFLWANEGLPMYNSMGYETVSIHGYSKEWGKWVTTGNVVY